MTAVSSTTTPAAFALAEVEGVDAALGIVEVLAQALDGYGPFQAVRADLLRRLGRDAEAAAAYEAALERTANAAERDFLARRLAEVRGGAAGAAGAAARDARGAAR